MKSREFFQQLIDGLTELEMTDLMEAADEYITRNQWGDLREQVFSDRDALDEAESNLEESVGENEELRDEIKDLNQGIGKAISELQEAQGAVEEDHPGWTCPELDKAIETLENL